MKDYIRYEDMPPSAQKAYNSTNSTRKVTMFIGGIGFIIAALSLLYSSVFDAEKGMTIFLPAAFITMIPGFVHAHLHFKKFLSKGLIGLAVWLFAVVVIGVYGCVIFLIMDIVRYIQKKPLIAKSEHKFFLESPAAQQEMMTAAIAADSRQYNTADSLKQLKEMYDSGIISEAEFNEKKAELLERM